MALNTLATDIIVLEDGKLQITVKSPSGIDTVYLQPDIIVDNKVDNGQCVLRDKNNDTINVDITVKTIDGVSFVGDFAALQTALRTAAKKANGFTRGTSSGGGGDASAANQILEIAELESIDEKLRLKECTYFDFSTSLGVPFGGYPITVTQLEWKNLLYQFPIVPNVIVNTDQEFVDLWNLNISENTLSVFGVNQFCLRRGTEDVLTNPAEAITVTTTGGPMIFSVSNFLQGVEPSVSNLDEILLKVDAILSDTNLLQSGEYTVGTITTETTYSPGAADNAVAILPANPNRHSVYIKIKGKDAIIRPLLASTDPADRKGHYRIKGATFSMTPDSSNNVYKGEISLINAKNGETPTYFIIEYINA